MELRLHSPVGAGRDLDLVYNWPTDDSSEKYSEEDLIEEIRETISAALPDHPELVFRIPPITALGAYDKLKELCDRWNDCVDVYVMGKTFSKTKASMPQAQHIIGQVYNKSVVFPERLNQYAAFSSHVYGETSPKMVSHMIKQLHITSEDTFLDLGSGVGQVVLQMAAAADFKRCIGIETCEVPCEYAVGLQAEFKRTMKWYGKTYSEFRLFNGDFLDKKFKETIQKSSIIFANNFAFGPEVDHQLKEIFADLDDGVRIVSSKEFSAVNFRINQRNLTDIGTIMNVSAMKPFEGAVSWTNSKVCFFLHVIDRTKLERYFEGSKTQVLPAEKPKKRPSRPQDENQSQNGDEVKVKKKRPKLKYTMATKKKKSPKKKRPKSDDRPPVIDRIDIPPPPLFDERPNKSAPRYDQDFRPPPEPELLKSKIHPRLPKKRKPPVISSPPREDLSRVSSHSVPAPSQQVDVYADAPWRHVPITPGPPKSVDELLARMRVQYFQMIDNMRTQGYAMQLYQEIMKERERNAALRSQKDCLEKIVSQLLKHGKDLLVVRLAELGFERNDWQSLFTELQTLVHEQARLSMDAAYLRREISVQEQINEQLQKHRVINEINEVIKEKRTLEKTVSKLTGELHEIEGKTPPSFPDSPNSDCDYANDSQLSYLPHPGRLYVNEMRSGYELPLRVEQRLKTVNPQPPAPAPTASANGTTISTSYKISPSSILPKKRR